MTSLKKHPRPAPPHRSLSTLFTLDFNAFEPPSSPLGALLWRHRMRFETTLGLSVLEPWEKILFMFIFMTITFLIATAFYKLLPAQLVWMYHRTMYYFLGSEHPVFAPAHGNWTVHRDLGLAHVFAAAVKR